ncbi:MAG: hypothetical protein PVF70_03215 [Anaerolineales bacterium]
MIAKKWLRLDLIIVLLAILARLLPGPRTIDDAYITFRYSRNLLAGQGLVYNPGEAVLGTTTPLYACLMAALGSVAGGPEAPFPAIAWLVNALADALTCWLLIRLGDRLGHRAAGLGAASVWAIAPWSIAFAIGGMETSVLIVLATLTFYLYLSDRPIAAALTASLSLLTRPDALLFVLPLAIDRVRRILPEGRLNPHRLPFTITEAACFLLPLAAWAAYAIPTYGSPIPQTMAAKAAAYRLPPEAGLVRMLQHYATPFLGHDILGTWWIGLGLALFPALCILGSVSALRNKVGAWPMFVFPWAHFAAFSLANPLIFRWYLVPPLPFYILGISLGVARLVHDLKRPRLGPVFAAAALALTLTGWTLRPNHGPTRPSPKMAYIELELLYRQVAHSLQEQAHPGDILAAGDIGTLGYWSELHIIDTVGLISPQAAQYYPLPDSAYVINYAIPTDLILDLGPDWLVILEAYGRETLLKDPEFQQAYALHERFPTDIYGSRDMLVFARSP